MGLKIKTLRYAHESGHTDVCYGSDNRNILTCGSDGNVRIWNGSDDDDPTADSVAEMALAVACYKDHFYVATDSNYVQAYSYADRKRDKIIFRFSAPVTHIAISSSGKFIAACSCDMEVQVMNIETNKITTFPGHTAPVLGISLDPLDEYIASSSCDGTVKIWDVQSGSLIKAFGDMIPMKNDFFKALCLGRTAWKSISGSLLAVPKDLDVIIFKRGTWDINCKLSSSKIEKSISVVLFSPCGNYVTAASISGEIIIWEIKHKSQVCYFNDPKKVGISGIAWHPDGSEIAFSDRLGRLGVLTGISEEISKHVVPEVNTEAKEIDIDEYSETVDPNTLFDDDNDEDDENCISLEKIKASYKNSSDNEDGSASPGSFTSTKMSKEPPILLTKLQPPFQPSSTPSHFEPRCLCFNSVGIVRYYDSDKTIDVQFHDTMFHHALFLRSFGTCTMATLSTNVLCLAVPSIDENLSKLSCLSLSSWAGNKEWSVHMPLNEDILALAAGDSWVAVATNANHMRIFTNGGTQKQIVSLPGPVVCISGFEQNLIVAFHQGMGVFECQNLGFIVYQIHRLCVRALIPSQPLPLSPKSVLKWLGFTDEGTPCSYDSEGVLRLLGHDLLHWSVAWSSQSQKKSSDYHFVIGLSEKYQNVRCILCRNSQYPLVINTPTVLEIPLKIPLCALDTEKSVQEEIFWRLMFSLHTFGKISGDRDYLTDAANIEKTLKQTALKLFADACRNSEDLRALDVASFMSNHPLELAIKYATKVGKVYLAEKLNGISPVDWKNQYLQSVQYSMGACIGSRSFDRKVDDNIDRTLYSQQDMFEDYSTTVEKENAPNEQPNKNSAQLSKPSPKTPKPSSVNPFRKAQVHQEEPLKGLKFFDTLTKEVPKLTRPTIQNKKLKLKPLNSIKEKESKTKKPTFVQWFSTRKTSLSEEYPNLSASELTKMGMKIYKDEMSKISSEDNVEEDQSEICVLESRKRSFEEVDGVDAKKCKSSEEAF